MTENEKIAQIKWLIEKHPVISKDKDFIEPLTDAIQALEENQEFHAIGTIEEFKALKEKNEPKKPEYVDTRFRNHGKHIGDGASLDKCYKCPNCNSHIFHVFDSETHCKHCGQKLDWD